MTSESGFLLRGAWRHGGGYLCCGTLRVAKADFDTDPSSGFVGEIMDWICKRLNAHAERAKPRPWTAEDVSDEQEQACLTASLNANSRKGEIAAACNIMGVPRPAVVDVERLADFIRNEIQLRPMDIEMDVICDVLRRELGAKGGA